MLQTWTIEYRTTYDLRSHAIVVHLNRHFNLAISPKLTLLRWTWANLNQLPSLLARALLPVGIAHRLVNGPQNLPIFVLLRWKPSGFHARYALIIDITRPGGERLNLL